MRPETQRVFVVSQPNRLALAFRKHRHLAHVYRAELFEKTKLRLPIRLHDTFVTVHLAHGKSETWIADRTGHKSSQMINTYRRQARTWVELGIDELASLDAIVPELASSATRADTARASTAQVA